MMSSSQHAPATIAPLGRTSDARSPADAIRRFRRLAIMDLRHGFGVWFVLPLVAGGGWYYLFSPASGPDVVLWGYQSVELSWAFAVIGPVGAGWGAWLAGRDRRSRTGALAASAPVSGVTQDARTLVVPLAGALGAYMLLAMVMLGRTAMEATWGGPVWIVILYGAAVTVGYALVGTVAGMLIPARLTPFIIVVGLFIFTIVSNSMLGFNSDFRYLAPYRWVSNPDAYDQLLYHARDQIPVPFSAAYGLVLGVTAVSLAVLALARHGRRPGIVLSVLAAIILAPSLAAAVDPDGEMLSYAAPVSYGGSSSQYGAIENPPLVCGGEIVVTCVHQAFHGQLDEVSSRVDAIVAPVAGLPGVPERLEQRADLLSTGDVDRFIDTWQWGGSEEVIERVTIDALFPSPVLFDSSGYDSEYDRTTAQAAIGLWLVMQAGGGQIYGPFPHEFVGVEHPRPDADGRMVQAAMVTYLAEVEAIQIDVNAAAERFAALTPQEQRAWLEANWDALRAGDLTLEDLP